MAGVVSGCQGALNIVGVPNGCQGALTLHMCPQGRGCNLEEMI